MIRTLLLFLLFSLASSEAMAQFFQNVYRPVTPRHEIVTDHFRVIFPAGEDSAAFRAAAILEYQYPIIQTLTGGSLRRFPVILNNHNLRSNAFVSPFNFRTEIEIPPLTGPSINPRTGGWMENVAPHELVHALHFSNIPPRSIPAIINVFSPDAARSIHSSGPPGMIEGIAVYHESNVAYAQGGRGNYPYFRNRALANYYGDDSWSLAQHFQRTRFNRPGDRHYVGGYQFTEWMVASYGPESIRAFIEHYVKYPFLGYGFALRSATGKFATPIFQEFKADQEKELEAHLERISQQAETPYTTLETGINGALVRSPLWLDEENLLLGLPTQFNRRPGFYTYNTQTNRLSLVAETHVTRDFHLWQNSDTREVFFSRFITHPTYSSGSSADIHSLNTETGRLTRISRAAGLQAPFLWDEHMNGLFAHHETLQWAEINDAGQSEISINIYPDTFISIKPSPDASHIAVIANRNGVQALWLLSDKTETEVLEDNPLIGFRDGSVIDFNWTHNSRSIYFTSDAGGVMNIYKYNLDLDTVYQLTNSRFNAFQPAESPDGNRLAFISQEADEQVPAIMQRDDFMMRELHKAEWQSQLVQRINRPRLASHIDPDSADLEIKPYRTGLSWLWPRVFGFEFEIRAANSFVGNQYTLALFGTDPLSRHSYQANLSLTQNTNRLWADVIYRNTSFWPGFEIEGFVRPRESSVGVIMERGGGIFFPFRYQLDDRARQIWIFFRPGFKLRELKLDFNTVPSDIADQFRTDWLSDRSVTAFLGYYHRLQQNIRDIQPNTGSIIFWQGEHFVGTERDPTPRGMRAGIIQYITPSVRTNSGFRFRAEVLTQSKNRIYGTSGLVYAGFAENIITGLHNAGSFSARYVFPISYVDDGFVSVPFVLERIYAALHVNTVADLNQRKDQTFWDTTRTVAGIELRTNFMFYNMAVNLGIGFGFEFTRNNMHVFYDGSTF